MEKIPQEQPPEPAPFELSNLLDLGHQGMRSFAFEGTSRMLFVSFGDRSPGEIDSGGDRLYQWDIASNSLAFTYSLEPGWMVDGLFVREGGGRLAVRLYRPRDPVDGVWGKYILMDTVEHRVMVPDFGLHNDRGAELWFDAGGKYLCIISTDLPGQPSKRLVLDAEGKAVEGPGDVCKPRPKGKLWVIESSKATLDTHGLYLSDEEGRDVKLTEKQWHDNYAMTKDGRYVGVTTWDGEFLVFHVREKQLVWREKIAPQYGYLAYDAKGDRFLIGDAMYNGTAFLRQVVIRAGR